MWVYFHNWETTLFPLKSDFLSDGPITWRTVQWSLSLLNWPCHWVVGYWWPIHRSWVVYWDWVGVDDVNRMNSNPCRGFLSLWVWSWWWLLRVRTRCFSVLSCVIHQKSLEWLGRRLSLMVKMIALGVMNLGRYNPPILIKSSSLSFPELLLRTALRKVRGSIYAP
jgi:hypothetical protein